MLEESKPNEFTLAAIKEVEQMKSAAPADNTYTNAEQMVEEILNEN